MKEIKPVQKRKSFKRGESSFSKKPLKSFHQKITINKKIILFIGIIVFVGLGIYFFINKPNEFKIDKSDDVQVYIYYSKGSRDAEKKEQYIFSTNDPMQVKIDFENMNDGTIATVSFKKVVNEEIIQSTEVPLGGQKGSRFVTLSQVIKKDVGKYNIEVVINIEGNQKILAKKEFEVR
ncbi:MAG: hypothetical protein KAT32_00595 [Candidatus Moranbacteria bacterium]|nr:hypothetical protein [Candidatus Moranbacteria bacterium]